MLIEEIKEEFESLLKLYGDKEDPNSKKDKKAFMDKLTILKEKIEYIFEYYTSKKNNYLDDPKLWIEYNNYSSKLDEEYRKFSTNYKRFLNHAEQKFIINAFDEIIISFGKFEKNILEIPNTVSWHKEKTEIEEYFTQLQESINIKLEEGINNLVSLKAEMQLEGNFEKNIKWQLNYSTTGKWIFFVLFVGSILGIGGLLFITKTDDITAKNVIFRFGFTIPLAILSYFFFSQYKLYHVVSMKFSHLNNFIGGGATFISQLTGQNAENRVEINKKLAEMFLEIDDILLSIKKVKYPVDASLESTSKLVESIPIRLLAHKRKGYYT